jgi:excisionase family DNA binding protein
MSTDPLQLLSPEQLSELFSVKVSWIHDAVEKKGLPVVRLPGSRLLRFRRSEVEKWLQELPAVA